MDVYSQVINCILPKLATISPPGCFRLHIQHHKSLDNFEKPITFPEYKFDSVRNGWRLDRTPFYLVLLDLGRTVHTRTLADRMITGENTIGHID